jgi:ATP-dependent exoDNAse (exonuclease V) alpha subunit
VALETLDGPTPYRAGDRVIIRKTIRDTGLHNGSVAIVQRVQGSVLFVERRDGQTVPIDTRQFPGVKHGYAHTEYREQGSTRYAELQLVDGYASTSAASSSV